MDRKIGVIVVALILGVAFAGELIVLSAQKTEQTSDTQTESVQNALPVQGTEQTTNTQTERAQNKLPAKTTPNSSGGENNSQVDATKQNTSTGGGINYLNVCLSLGGIGTFLFGLTALLKFIWKARSKVDMPYSAEDIDKQDINEKLDRIQKAVEQDPKVSLLKKSIADAYTLQRVERIEEAIQKWRSIANIAEGNDNDLASKALASVGYLYVKEGKGKHGLSSLNKAIKLKPDFDEVYNNRGVTKNWLGKHQDALVDYDKAIQLKPDFAEAYSNRGTTKNLLGKYQDALVDYDIAIRLKPDNAQTYSKRGLTRYLLKKHKDAIADYDTAILLKTDYAEAYYYRGHANNALEKYEAALEDYSKAIELRLDDPAAYSNRGFIHFKLGRCRKAITDYNEAIRLKSDVTGGPHIQENSISFSLEDTKFDEAEVYINRGVAKSQLGEYEEALVDYNEAIRLKPDNVEVYINRGPTNLILGEYAEALVDLNEVIRLQPDFARAYVNRAEAKVNLNHINEAKSDFQTALELAEQQNNTALKTNIEKRLQELNNSTP